MWLKPDVLVFVTGPLDKSNGNVAPNAHRINNLNTCSCYATKLKRDYQYYRILDYINATAFLFYLKYFIILDEDLNPVNSEYCRRLQPTDK